MPRIKNNNITITVIIQQNEHPNRTRQTPCQARSRSRTSKYVRQGRGASKYNSARNARNTRNIKRCKHCNNIGKQRSCHNTASKHPRRNNKYNDEQWKRDCRRKREQQLKRDANFERKFNKLPPQHTKQYRHAKPAKSPTFTGLPQCDNANAFTYAPNWRDVLPNIRRINNKPNADYHNCVRKRR
jgi:hypothetical protein